VSESGGSLHITAQKQPNGTYWSRLVAAVNFAQAYGFWEVRARAAPGNAMWPAFWQLDTFSTGRYEIDDPEWTGTHPTQTAWSTHDLTAGLGGTLAVTSGFDTTADYHVYGMDWEPDHVTYYLDGTLIGSAGYTPPAVPLHPQLDLAVGSSWSWVGRIDATTPATSSFDVDYVRVWQAVPGSL
jgi:serralysin